MGSIINLLTRIAQISTFIDLGKKVVDLVKLGRNKTPLLPTPTDLLLESIDIADRAAYDMETVMLTINQFCGEPQTEEERKKTHNQRMKEKFIQYGLDEATFEQMKIWAKNAEFGWTSFRDELKILVGERMSEEQKKDIVTYKPRDKTKVKIKLSNERVE